LFQVLAFNLKVFFFCWLQVLIRWTYPRFRYDQVMDLGWKLLVPLSLVNISATAILMSLIG
jgi:NADH-quinone oxidoreductase subunit H